MARRRTPEQVKANMTEAAPTLDYEVKYNDDFTAMHAPVENYIGISRAGRMDRGSFSPHNIGGDGISGREGMTMMDYEAWRPAETSVFRTHKETIIACDIAYKKHGIIRNIIDLMGDFASQGIRISHPNKKIQTFYRNWFKKVRGVERSERFLNHLYRLGNVVVRLQTAKINKRYRDRMYQAMAKPEIDLTLETQPKNEIPWRYTFIHPATVEALGGEFATFVNDPRYAIKLPKKLNKLIGTPAEATAVQREIINSLPAEIKEAVLTNKAVMLPVDKTRVFHYKKDDWQEWADPMISGILVDLTLYDKLKLADKVALDGAISNIRIFKLGSLEHKIAPSPAAIATLANMLESQVAGGACDIVWGPDIELIESKSQIHQFLGEDKYKPTLLAIYGGMGIPPTLTGTFGSGGTTNNFISLKTLTQRLEYGREILLEFWQEQMAVVQEAMGFKHPPIIEFDLMNLGDEAAEKALLIQLADRSLISDELLQRYFGNDSEMEQVRLNSEKIEREKGKRVPKAGAWHNPELESDLKKIFAQRGVVTPGEMGIELEERQDGEISPLEVQQEGQQMKIQQQKQKGQPQQGRPKNSKDTTKRQTKTFKPKVKAALEIWANQAQDQIAEIMNPAILKAYSKKNMRGLSASETEEVEISKFGVLCNLKPFSEITNDSVFSALQSDYKDGIFDQYNSFAEDVSQSIGRKLTLEDRKHIQSQIYADMEIENGTDSN